MEQIDLPDLQQRLGNKVDLYAIDSSGVVRHSTLTEDIGLDFRQWPDFHAYLEDIRQSGELHIDAVSKETKTGLFRKYAYLATPDKRWILELGVKSDIIAQRLAPFDPVVVARRLVADHPHLNQLRIIDRHGWQLSMTQPSLVEPEVFERVKQVLDTRQAQNILGWNRKLTYLPLPDSADEVSFGLRMQVVELDCNLSRVKFGLGINLLVALAAMTLVLLLSRGMKRVEEKLRESESKLSTLFSSMTEMVVLHDLVCNGEGKPINYRITDCNAAFTKTTGIPREKAVGRLATEVYGSEEPPYLKEFSGVALSGESYRYETYFPPMEKHFFISVVSPEKNRFATVTTDITERKRAEISLHNAEQNTQFQLTFHRIAAETATALTTATSDTEFDAAINQCLQRLGLLFGADRSYVFQFSDDLAYTTNTHEWCADGIAPEMDNLQHLLIDDWSWLITQLLRDGVLYARVADLPPEAAAIKAEFQRQGIQSFLHATTHGAHGKLAGFIGFDSVCKEHSWREEELAMLQSIAGVVGSVSVSRQAQSALERKNQEMEQFVYIVSHDLKSPLVTVRTYAGMLRQDLLNADQQQITEDLNYIDKAANKMQQLLDALMKYSRIGTVDVPAQTVSADQQLHNCLTTLAGILQQHEVQVTTGDLPHQFLGDPMHFGQIWQNLIENAVKYRGDQPQLHIEIGATQEGQDVVFYVRDNGMGIAPEHNERIFNLFAQLQPGSDGSGLGLALVKKIVTIYQGHIWVESEGEGRGSCFYFTLPGALIKEATSI